MRASSILGRDSKVLSPGEAVLSLQDDGDPLAALLDVIGRHPLRHSQVMNALAGIPEREVAEVLRSLEAGDKVRTVRRHGERFWVSASARFSRE
jgi:hypothetical protein